MNRRQALAWGIGAAVAIPVGWISISCSKLEKDVSADQIALLSAAVDAILPATETPGAKDLGVHLFVAKMVADCYGEDVQKEFEKGVNGLEKKAKSGYKAGFTEIEPEQRLAILKNFPEESGFIALLRQLTILGYTKSEYFMENIEKFEFIPGRYVGCVNLV